MDFVLRREAARDGDMVVCRHGETIVLRVTRPRHWGAEVRALLLTVGAALGGAVAAAAVVQRLPGELAAWHLGLLAAAFFVPLVAVGRAASPRREVVVTEGATRVRRLVPRPGLRFWSTAFDAIDAGEERLAQLELLWGGTFGAWLSGPEGGRRLIEIGTSTVANKALTRQGYRFQAPLGVDGKPIGSIALHPLFVEARVSLGEGARESPGFEHHLLAVALTLLLRTQTQ